MKVLKILLTILAVTVFNMIVGMLTCGGYFSWVYKIEPTNVWKPVANLSFLLMVSEILVTNILFVGGYLLVKKGIPGPNKFVKGLLYGLLVWAVGTIPGMVSTSLYMTVSPVVVIYWTIWGLVVSPLKGLIASAILSE